MSRPPRYTLVGLALVAIVVLRFAAVADWHVPGGDGLQYYALSQQLSQSGRLAFRAPPAPPSWSRLPGYPLFLSKVAVRQAPLPLSAHLRRATIWNVLLDLVTALFCCLLVREVVSSRVAWVSCLFLVLCCPILIFLSCFGLTESIATCLATINLWLALRSRRSRPLLYAGLAGAVAGLSQLVRVDALSVTAACLVALAYPRRPLRVTASAVGVFLLAALVCYAPWPLRNLRQFGAPHFEGSEWLAQDGRPLPNGIMKWMRSWASGKIGQDYMLLRVANDSPLSPGFVSPGIYDSAEEAAATADLFNAYNREGLSKAVNERFIALARERARRRPFREYVRLPLERAFALWEPIPEYELPVRTNVLGLPRLRSVYDAVDLALYGLCIVGIVVGWRRNRGVTLTLVTAILARTLLHASAAHPCPTQRYVAVAFPAILIFASLAIEAFHRRLGPDDVPA